MKKHVPTPATIDGLTEGALKDPTTPGLRIEVQASGRKIWKYERRVARSATLVRLTLGAFPRMDDGRSKGMGDRSQREN